MEGTVTISLEDFMQLKKYKEKEEYYFRLVADYVDLLEDVESLLVERGIETTLVSRIDFALSEWYG